MTSSRTTTNPRRISAYLLFDVRNKWWWMAVEMGKDWAGGADEEEVEEKGEPLADEEEEEEEADEAEIIVPTELYVRRGGMCVLLNEERVKVVDNPMEGT